MNSNLRVMWGMLAVFLVLAPTACSKRLMTRMRRAAKIAARPQETRPLPNNAPQSPSGNQKNNPPPVDENPSQEPVRFFLGEVTLDRALETELAKDGFVPGVNCFQYVWSNYVESIEISDTSCPKNGELVPWTQVKTTLYFYTPDSVPMFSIYHPQMQNVDIGFLIEDLSAPGNAYIYSLCDGNYRADDKTGKAGCQMTFTADGYLQEFLLQDQL